MRKSIYKKKREMKKSLILKMSFSTAIYRERSLGGSHANGTIPWRMKSTIIKETIQSTGSDERNYARGKNRDSLKANKNYKESNIFPAAC